MKEALLRFTVFVFSGQTHSQWECYGHFYDSIKIAIFKTLRSLDTTWNFACSITRVSTHEHEHWEHCLSLLKKMFFSAFIIIMLLHKSLTHIHKRSKVAVWREFHFNTNIALYKYILTSPSGCCHCCVTSNHSSLEMSGVDGSAPSIQIRISTLSGTFFGHFTRPGTARVKPARQTEASRGRTDRSDRSRDDIRRSSMDVRGTCCYQAVTFLIAKAGADTHLCQIVNPRKEFQISKEWASRWDITVSHWS